LRSFRPFSRAGRAIAGAGVLSVLALGSVVSAGPAQATQSFGDAVVAQAASHIGAPYEWGAAGPATFDCSGLVMTVFGTFGVRLPHYTVDQYAQSQHVAQDQKQVGDVIFFYDTAGYIFHDGIYIGNNTMIAATHEGDFVRQEAIWTPSYLVGRYPAPAGFVGTTTLPGAIGARYAALGGQSGFLGLPVTPESSAATGGGRYVHFQGGSIYWSPASGPWEVHGDIRATWAALGWETSVIGYPITNELGTPDGRGRFNHFQSGSVYWSPQTGAHEVLGAIRSEWSGIGWENSVLGYPVTNELPTPGSTGAFNHFQGGSVYWSPASGAHEVQGAIRATWAGMGWETGQLGFPTSDEYAVPGGRASDFTGGTLRWDAGTGAVTG
jgi:uncharacterized protein with LGFP repeats